MPNRNTIEADDNHIESQLEIYGAWLSGLPGLSTSPSAGLRIVDAEPVEQPASAQGKSRWLLVAASVFLVSIAAAVAIDRSPQTTTAVGADLILTGEPLIRSEPLVVQATASPEPEFDTQALGREIRFDPLPDDSAAIEELIEMAIGFDSFEPESDLLKLTVLGEVEGTPWAVSVTQERTIDGAGLVLRTSTLVSTEGGSGGGDYVDPNSLQLIEMRPSGQQLMPNGAGYGAPTGWVEWNLLPSDVSVVAFADSDQKLWIKPRNGVAVFPAQFDEGERFTVEAFDAQGNLLGSTGETVRYQDDFQQTALKVDEELGQISAIDLATGDTIEIGGNGRPSVIIIGAEWCVPCWEIENQDSLTTIADTVNIYAVRFTDDGGKPWPADNWPYLRVEVSRTRLNEIAGVPLALILDSENRVSVYQPGEIDVRRLLQASDISD